MTELANEMATTHPRSPMRDAWRRFARNKLALAGLIIVGLLVFTAIAAPILAPKDPAAAVLDDKRARPSSEYLLGADELGRDILSRLIYGSRVALMVAVLAVGTATVIGGAIGLISGFLGGWVDEVLMRLMDILLAFPYLLLAIAVVAALGAGVWKTTIAVAIWAVPNFPRVVRGQVLTIKER
ncbi:MAG TPA: ABC transporter permease, partial [Thermomicrobiales bacterium]|nr:ABC transporter permease [Thermomicrobiales bacterium]